MRPFSCSACRGGLFRISFFSRVLTLFLSVFSRLDDERGTARGGQEEAGGEKEEAEEVSAGRSVVGPERRWAGMVVRMKSGRAGRRRRWERTDWGIICQGGRVNMYVGWMEERMEERMEGCKYPVWKFREREWWWWSQRAVRKLMGRGGPFYVTWWSGCSDERQHEVVTYETFSCHPRPHCGPASPRCPLASESTEARCLTGFHGPGRGGKGKLFVLTASNINIK